MADLLYDLLASSPSSTLPPGPPDADSLAYLASLAEKPLVTLHSAEPLALAQSSQSLLLSLQGLAKKSYQPVLESARRHAALRTALPDLAASTAELKAAIPSLDDEVVRFSSTYRPGRVTATSLPLASSSSSARKPTSSAAATAAASSAAAVLARRRQALLLSRNVERLVDVLELPPLLSSAVSTTPVNYSSALDLNGHIRRLHALYPDSPLVQSVAAEATDSMRATAASLVLSLKAPGLKLAASLRTISWLRRVLPDLEAAAAGVGARGGAGGGGGGGGAVPHHPPHEVAEQERALGALFLVCRLATLATMLDALAPLRDLADQERARQKTIGAGSSWSGGQQTERYLKRYIEIFREQSFAIVSMFRSIFPADGPGTTATATATATATTTATTQTASKASASTAAPSCAHSSAPDPLEPLPDALATFPLHLVDMLLDTLRQYLPTVRDQASRDSLLTQVLYCAGSLGRLGGDFGLFLATLDVGSDAEDEWVEVVRRHRQLAGRLESIVGDPRERKERATAKA